MEFLCASLDRSFLLVTLGRGLCVKEKVENVEEENGSTRGHFLKLSVINSGTSGLKAGHRETRTSPPPAAGGGRWAAREHIGPVRTQICAECHPTPQCHF